MATTLRYSPDKRVKITSTFGWTGEAEPIYCGGKRTLAVLTRFGWRCAHCGEQVKVAAP